MRYGRIVLFALAAVVLLTAGACSDDAGNEVNDAVDAVEDRVGEAGARAGAEAFRVTLENEDADGANGGLRNVDVLQAAAEDLPGDPEIVGIADGNGDGVDDDGFVQFNVGDEAACVEVPASGNNVEVTGGACPST